MDTQHLVRIFIYMKQMSQMKKIIIAAVAIATLMSCQSEKDKLIDEKIASIDSQLESIELIEEDFNRYMEILEREDFNPTDEELEFMAEHDYKSNLHTQLTEKREYWVLQK